MDEIKLTESLESFWNSTAEVDNYPKLDKDLETEVAVVGGGIAGILVAYELASRGKK